MIELTMKNEEKRMKLIATEQEAAELRKQLYEAKMRLFQSSQAQNPYYYPPYSAQ